MDVFTWYKSRGNSGLAVIFGCGTDAEPSDYKRLFRYLNNRGITVLASNNPYVVYSDLLEGVDVLKKSRYTKIVAMGHSRGSGAALTAASKTPDIVKVIPITPGWHTLENPISLPTCPAFLVTAELDNLSRPDLVKSKIVDVYPGLIVHKIRKGADHFNIVLDEVTFAYINAYINDDLLFNYIYSDTRWI